MSDLSPERAESLERGRVEARNLWRISEKLGDPPTEAQKIWDILRLEVTFYCSDFHGGQSIATHGRLWVENRNPYHVDAAVALCQKYDCDLPPTLVDLVKQVAWARLRGETRSGTPAKILREAARDHALSMMTCLCAAGLTLENAASKAAAELLKPVYGARYKVSALQKLYTKRWREIEKDRRAVFDAEDGALMLQEWQRIIPDLPDAPEELRGERR